ncbi:unnamed protein product, partial [Haemonchus placei]|uniref:Fibrinogen C-terminal domain-containing protein n=1 Tax=Haemonchus placei TaxID=6290 RepID=A0A0N4WAV8_HAEPC
FIETIKGIICHSGDVPFPKTCDEFANRTDQVKTIYINNNPIDVYCQYGTSGAYTPGKGNNFWLGLDNMVALTSQGNYDLIIEVCCGGTNSIQFYRNFTVTAWTFLNLTRLHKNFNALTDQNFCRNGPPSWRSGICRAFDFA